MIILEQDLEKQIPSVTLNHTIVFPTDTVYGIGASIQSPSAIKHIYDIKHRPSEKSLIILCANQVQMEEIVGPLSPQIEKLVATFMPGGLTLILKPIIPLLDEITRGKDTIGIRIPNHPTALRLLEALGPLATTSANLSGEPSPTEIDPASPVVQDADLAIDGGPTKEQIPSTILDCTVNPPVILRQGAISEVEINKVMNNN